ncbi:MAG: Na+/H+ antiporter NhaA [Deltaproteobacteria bacterium]|nr:Na+/H+ antiporter NhaA [Deltaproteobacteria bacterium]
MKQPPSSFPRLFQAGESFGELLLRPVRTFVSLQFSGGLVILVMTALALYWANSSFGTLYERLLHTHFSIAAYGHALDKPLHFWINEGLMTLFFFVVGLEIKREVLIGELASFKQAALPAAAAVGGMLAPAAFYYLLNPVGIPARGWAIPMATDIAFAIGVLTLLKGRVPRSLLVFVSALAIADDLGAVLVIAVFYTSQISVFDLQVAGGLLFALVAINLLGYRYRFLYVVLGCLVWLEVYLSGVHSTVAGILVALTIPARSKCNTDEFLRSARVLLDRFECAGECGYSVHTNRDHQEAVRRIESMCQAVEPPLLRIERLLSPWVVFGVVPLFALANAGVHVDLHAVEGVFTSSVPLGIFLGLVFGKQVGIFCASWLAARSGIALLPTGASWLQLYGCSALCGIGFTMSIFIADLAFAGTGFLYSAKLGILLASLTSLVFGLALLFWGGRPLLLRGTALDQAMQVDAR